MNLQGLTINPPFCQDDIQTASTPIRSPVNFCRQSGFPAIPTCSSMGGWEWLAGLQCLHAEYRHLHSGGECGVASFSKANAGVLAEEWNRRHGLKGNRTAGRELAANPQNLHALRIRRRLPPRLHGRAHCGNRRASLPPQQPEHPPRQHSRIPSGGTIQVGR